MSASEPTRRPSTARRTAGWLFGLVLGPLLLLAALEAGLRASGQGEPKGLLLQKEAAGQSFYVPNKAFYQQFCGLPVDRIMTWDDLDFQALAQKPEDTFRIVVFGGSAAYGPHGFPRILSVMLRHAFPGIHFEICNTACPGMNSNVMWAAARQSIPLEPDLFLVYMGNNEYIGPFGPTTRIAENPLLWRPAAIRGLILLGRSRVFQGVAGGGLQPWQIPSADALYQSQPGLTRDQRAIRHYEANLRSISATGLRAGSGVVLCTLANNMDLGGAQEVPPESREEDSINGTIRRVAGEEASAGVRLADVKEALVAAGPDATPGFEFFIDSVHFNFDGNYVTARTIFDSVATVVQGRYPDSEANTADVLSREECAKRLGWTDAAQMEKLQFQLRAFFDEESRKVLEARHAKVQACVGSDWRVALAEGYRVASEQSPEDWLLRHKHIEALSAAGKPNLALEQALALAEKFPWTRVAERDLAHAYQALGKTKEAEAAFRRTLAAYPDDYGTYNDFAGLLRENGKHEEALARYRMYIAADPVDMHARCGVGDILSEQGDLDTAEAVYREALSIAPWNGLPYARLDALWQKRKTPAERVVAWEGFRARFPEAAGARFQLGMARMETDDLPGAIEAYGKATELEPGDPAIHIALGQAMEQAGKLQDAVVSYRKATALNPDSPHVRLRLVEALLRTGETAEAVQQARQAGERGVTLPPALLAEMGISMETATSGQDENESESGGV